MKSHGRKHEGKHPRLNEQTLEIQSDEEDQQKVDRTIPYPRGRDRSEEVLGNETISLRHKRRISRRQHQRWVHRS
jgi:hypothetical protein